MLGEPTWLYTRASPQNIAKRLENVSCVTERQYQICCLLFEGFMAYF